MALKEEEIMIIRELGQLIAHNLPDYYRGEKGMLTTVLEKVDDIDILMQIALYAKNSNSLKVVPDDRHGQFALMIHRFVESIRCLWWIYRMREGGYTKRPQRAVYISLYTGWVNAEIDNRLITAADTEMGLREGL
jgi:hypothetical protein